jgi:hypothetical protein
LQFDVVLGVENHQTSPKLQRPGADVLHARHHRVGAEEKGFSED